MLNEIKKQLRLGHVKWLKLFLNSHENVTCLTPMLKNWYKNPGKIIQIKRYRILPQPCALQMSRTWQLGTYFL